MVNTLIIVGAQWGDEGKGKIVDVLTERADMVVRFSGGNNAGHTVVVGDTKYAFHLLPSGIIHPSKINVIANGTVLDLDVLESEIKKMEDAGFTIGPDQLVISSSAHVILDKHITEDNPDTSDHSKKIGTTGRGIGPCYQDKIRRSGTRLGDHIGSGAHARLKNHVVNTQNIVNTAIDAKKKVLFEGAQGTLLDIDHGTYPFVTSSNPIAGGACTGAGVGPTKIDAVCGIFKAYVTRVGEGPFPTELGTYDETKDESSAKTLREAGTYEEALKNELAKANSDDALASGRYMRMQGAEYGTTTGRPRRTGWFDAVAGKFAVSVNGMTSFVLTKLDVLSGLENIKICTSYEGQDGYMLDGLGSAHPVYESVPGWHEDITTATTFDQLPKAAQAYVRRLEQLLGIPCSIVSVGPKRSQTIFLSEEGLL